MRHKHGQFDNLVDRLHEHGFRLTPQRMAILQTLIGSSKHLNAEEIYEHVHNDYPMISLSTVYKTIALFLEMGVITELNFSNQNTRYEILNGPPHPHFICTECWDIIDLEDRILGNLPERITRKTGHKIIKTRLDFYGLCQECQSG